MRRLNFILIFFIITQISFGQDSLPKSKLTYPQIILKTTPVGFFYAINYVALSTEIKFSSHHAYEIDLGFVNPYTGVNYKRIMPEDEDEKYGFRLINSYKYYLLDDINKKNQVRNKKQYLGFDLQTNFHQVKTEYNYYRHNFLYQQLYPTTKQTITVGFGIRYGLLSYIGKKRKGVIDFYSGLGYIAYKRKYIADIPSDAILIHQYNDRYIGSGNHLRYSNLTNMFNFIVGIKFGYKVR